MSIDEFFKKVMYYAFHALLLVTPLLWTPKMSELFEFPKMLFVYFCTLLVSTSWIAVMLVRKKWILRKTFLDIPILLFAISQIISTVLSIDAHTSLFGYYSRFHGGLLSTVSYVILYYAFVSFMTKIKAKKLLKSLLVGAVLSSAYAFVEHFGVSPSCAIIGSGWQADCWIQDVVLRVFGTFGQPNWLAAYLISILFIPLSLLFDDQGKFIFLKKFGKKKKNIKIIWPSLSPAFLFIFFFIVLMFTKSRSGMLGFAVGILLFSLALLKILDNKKQALLFLLATYLSLVASYIILGKGTLATVDRYIFPVNESQTTEKTVQETQKIQVGTVLDTGGTESGDIRKIVWKGAIDVFLDKPIFGTGVETFAYSYYNHRPVEHNLVSEWDFLYNKAHNELLNFLANSGVFGLATYLSMMGVFAIWTVKVILDSTYSKKSRVLTAAFLSGYASLAISNFFGFSTVVVGTLFFLFPAFLLILTESVTNKEEQSDSFILSNSSSFWIFSLFVFSLFVSYKIYTIYLADKYFSAGKTAYAQENLQQSLQLLEKSINYQKNEPEYTNEFSKVAASAALSLYAQNNASAGAQIASVAIAASTKTLEKNNVHLNYYKNRAKILANLGRYEPSLLKASADVMREALALSPTDPKLYFSLGLLLNEQKDIPASLENIEIAIQMKPNYELARYTLGEMYAQLGKEDEAREQYEYILKKISPKNTQVIKALENL